MSSVQHADGSPVIRSFLLILILLVLPPLVRAEPKELVSSLTLERVVADAIHDNAVELFCR